MMAQYTTKQRKALIEYLKSNPDRQLTARQIADALEVSGCSKISRSAVYRNLQLLKNEGIISLVTQDSARESVYQYIDSDECRECVHLTCTRCGQIQHLRTSAADELVKNASDTDGFEIDRQKTVIYGVCKTCCRKNK
ncbi:MAG TPA: transcriptional repressor [Bacillota bacterium]|nr:transcriptional repressor [Bacillota bacterium]